MGLMVRPGGVVLGVEVVGPLAGRSVEAIGRASPGLMQEGTVRVMQGNVMEGERGRGGEGQKVLEREAGSKGDAWGAWQYCWTCQPPGTAVLGLQFGR